MRRISLLMGQERAPAPTISRWRRAILFSAAVVNLSLTAAFAQPAFSRRDLQIPNQFGNFLGIGAAITIGDFNGDGRPDVVLNSLEGFSVMLNSASGLGAPKFYPFRTCGAPVMADFNGDGKLDLYMAESCDFAGSMLLGRGDGTFSTPREIPNCNYAAVGDLNKDGIPDLACNDAATTSLRVLLGNGDGTFRFGATIQTGPGQAGQIMIADFNRDGKPDIAATFPNDIAVFPGNGDGTFGGPVQTRVASLPITIADFNGDGAPDLATTSGIYPGKGDGGFGPAQPYPTAGDGRYAHPIAVADLDGDGHPDIVMGGQDIYPVADRVWVLLGHGDGTMSSPIEYAVGWGPFAGAVADLDGDGRYDVVTANLVSNTVSLLFTRNAGDSRQNRAVSAASGKRVVAPGSLATVYLPGSGAIVAQAGAAPWPTVLGGVGLQVRDTAGVTRLAPLLYVSGTQINFQVPDDCALGEATFAIVRDGAAVEAGTMQVEAVAPAIFMANPVSMTAAAWNQRIESDGSQSSHLLYDCSGSVACVPLSAAPSEKGSFVTFYGTGFRNASLSNVTCHIYGYAGTVVSAEPQGTPGLEQISIRLPEPDDDFWDQTPAADAVCNIGGVLANRVWLLFTKQP
jgi:uncharacterized protein (TIGR03437 family)